MEEVGEGRRTVSVCEVWKDVRGGRGDEGLVEGGEVVVEIWSKVELRQVPRLTSCGSQAGDQCL